MTTHHSSRMGAEAVRINDRFTLDWARVTCGDCRLEQPMEKLAEYRVPGDVLARDALLAEIERHASGERDRWESVRRDAQRLRETSAGVPEGSEGREGLSGALSGQRVVRVHAPVNSVDIRTEVRKDEGMTNPGIVPLSAEAEKAFKSVRGSAIGSRITEPMSDAVWGELRKFGLIGLIGGLTVKGSIQKARRDSASLDALFGSE